MPSALQGQTLSTVPPRIVQAVDEANVVKLRGGTPALARTEYDQGEAPASTQLTHIRLVLSRSAEQEAALAAHEAELENKSSPNYHQWMTPQQFGKLYGPADSDIAAITGWLESHGLAVEPVGPGRTNLAFSGSVAQVEEAFHVSIHSYLAGEHRFYSNTSDPSIPAALAAVVKGVAHLNTIPPIANHAKGVPGMLDRGTKRMVPQSLSTKAAKPDLTQGGNFLFMVAGDAATIYDSPNTYNASFSSGTSYTGSGVTIGIAGDAVINTSTAANYRSLFLGNSQAPTVTNVDGTTSTDDTDEAYIDTELSGALAPGATIHFYTATDLGTAINRALSDNTIDILSLSFGLCELELTTAGNQELSGLWQQAYNQGIPVTVSTGDTGSASCDAIDPSSQVTALYGLSVSGFAATPYNVAVGGTDLDGLNTSFSMYVSTSQGSASTYYRTALSYIPESTWNDSTQTDTTISANVPWATVAAGASISAGSGGASSCSVNTNAAATEGSFDGSCTSGTAKPTWQRGTGVPSDGVRDIPDVSLMSGNGYDPATWLICTDDAVQNSTSTDNCAADSGGNFYASGFGGTSTAAPAFAGILAMVEQKTGSRLGLAAKELYDLYNGAHFATVFHDTTIGNNSVACNSGTPNCVKNAVGNYFESSYNTNAGYDLATGLGSVDATQLITYWGSAVGSAAATLTLTPSTTSVTSSVAITVGATVTGGSGTPTGTVTLTTGSYTSGAQTLSGGAFTFSVPAGTLVAGGNTLTVSYSGDATYAATTGTTVVTYIAPIVSLSPTSLTFAATAEGTTDPTTQSTTLTNSGTAALALGGITITGTNASSFSESSTCPASLGIGANCVITVTFAPTAVGSLTASISVADNAGGSPQTVTLTGTGAEVGSYVLAAAAATVAPGSTTTSAITATGSGGYMGPNTVTLSGCVLATAPSGAVDSPTCSVTASTVTFASGSTSGSGGTVTINTTAASSSARKKAMLEHGAGGSWPGGVGAVAVAGLLLLIPGRMRKWRALLGAFVLVAALGVLSGCGGGGGGGGGTSNPGTTAGTYTFTVTGTDSGSVQQTATLTLTVN